MNRDTICIRMENIYKIFAGYFRNYFTQYSLKILQIHDINL